MILLLNSPITKLKPWNINSWNPKSCFFFGLVSDEISRLQFPVQNWASPFHFLRKNPVETFITYCESWPASRSGRKKLLGWILLAREGEVLVKPRHGSQEKWHPEALCDAAMEGRLFDLRWGWFWVDFFGKSDDWHPRFFFWVGRELSWGVFFFRFENAIWILGMECFMFFFQETSSKLRVEKDE